MVLNIRSGYGKPIVVLLLLVVLVWCGFTTFALASEPIKVGVVASITGWAGFIGTPQKELFTAIAEEVNAKGGIDGRLVEIYLEDDKSVPTNAVIAATKLIKDKKVCALIGASTSDSSAAIFPSVEQEKVPFIVSAPVTNPKKEYVFLIGPSGETCAAHVIEYAVNNMKKKKIALLHDQSTYGMTGANTIAKEATRYAGVSIVAKETFEPADTNLVPLLSNVKASGAEMIILYATTPSAVVAAKNYKQLGMSIPVLCSNAISTPDFLKLAGKTAEEASWILFTQPFSVAEKMSAESSFRKDLYDPLKKMMKTKYGDAKEVNLFHTTTYDAITVLMEAIKFAGSDRRDDIKKGLESVKFNGFIGPFACTPTNHQGAADKDPMIPVIIQNGAYAPYSI